MSFQAPMSVKDILDGIHHKEYLLPAIQREFVWDGGQIRRLVDSLMRGYPIGPFLVWPTKKPRRQTGPQMRGTGLATASTRRQARP